MFNRWLQARRRPADAQETGPAPLPPYVWAIGLAIGALYLVFDMHSPIGLLSGAAYDDAWFFEHANKLLQGRWFGHYDNLTLMKGPGYAFFLALNSLLGVSEILGEGALYVVACGLFSRTAFRLGAPAPLALALFATLVWHPAMFPYSTVRDNIYAAQVLIWLSCLVQVLFLPANPRSRTVWALSGGVALAWCWMTREEGVWLAPAGLGLLVVGLWLKPSRLAAAGLFCLAAVVPCLMVSAVNFAVYRTFEIVDFKGPAYSHAVQALQKVRVGEPQPFTPVPRKVRAAIYEASPSFARLRAYFEAPDNAWIGLACPSREASCMDFPGSLFIWAFRDAVASAGAYRSASEAKAFYQQLTAEVDAACRSGRLRCVNTVVAYMPSITPVQWARLPWRLGLLANIMLDGNGRYPQPDSLDPDPGHLQAMWEFEGHPRRRPATWEASSTLKGWFYAPSDAWLQAACTDKDRTQVIPFQHVTSPDIADHFADPAAIDRRFQVKLPEEGTCVIQATGRLASAPPIPRAELKGHVPITVGGHELYIDIGGKTYPKVPTRGLALLDCLYGKLLPALLIAAIAAWLVHVVRLMRRTLAVDPYWWVTHALWGLVLCRLALILAVDLSSFDALQPTYLFPAHALFTAAMLMTIGLVLRPAREAPATVGPACQAPVGGQAAARS